MFKRVTSGSVVCPSCGRLVGVKDERCMSCGKWNPGLWGFRPLLNRFGRDLGFMEIVIGVCSLLFILSYAFAPRPLPQSFSMEALFSLLSAEQEGLYQFGGSGLLPVFVAGRWWTVLSAGWLHGGLLHIAMNMMCLRQLVPAVGELFGTSRLVIIYILSSATGFLLTSTVAFFSRGAYGATLTIGASAALMGLAGAMICYGQRTGSKMMTQMILRWVIILFVVGFFMGMIDNWAHLGGLAGGYVVARLLDPLREEKPGHSLAALLLLALTVVSLLMSFFRGPSWMEVLRMVGWA